MSRLIRFLKALFLHSFRGFPKSSISTINYRFAICNNCEYYDNVNKQCLQCGCNISNEQIFLNKLAWNDQKCPLDKW